jgi:hypothetical protein
MVWSQSKGSGGLIACLHLSLACILVVVITIFASSITTSQKEGGCCHAEPDIVATRGRGSHACLRWRPASVRCHRIAVGSATAPWLAAHRTLPRPQQIWAAIACRGRRRTSLRQTRWSGHFWRKPQLPIAEEEGGHHSGDGKGGAVGTVAWGVKWGWVSAWRVEQT